MFARKKSMTLVVPILIATLMLAGCASRKAAPRQEEPARKTHELLNAVLWVQTSAEYDFACREIYMLARFNLDEAMADASWTAALEQTGDYESLPPAVILDVDETALDNSAFEAKLIRETGEYNRPLWYAWAEQERARAVPGAKEFLEYARESGVAVFFVTNRDHAIEEPTVRNLQSEFGMEVTGETVLTRGEMEGWTSDKSSRRAYLAECHRILLLIGDDYNDFAYLGQPLPEERLAAARQYTSYWGSRWILLPNPMYGGWEQALYGHKRDLLDVEKLESKYRHLHTEP